MSDELRDAILRPVDIASLAAFRAIFGVVMCLGIVRFLATGWIDPMYAEPRWFFSYPGFAWVVPWPAWGMYVHYGALAVLALAIAVGVFHRVVTLLFVAGFAYTQLIDVTNYLNHHYLVVLLGVQLAFLPANAAWSIDVRRRPELRRATVAAWMVWLLRFQVGVVYVFAGLAKAKLDWLEHGQALNLWLTARTETPVVGELFGRPWVALAMAWAGFLFDSTIVVWLSWRRTRLVAFGALIVFHGLTGYLFNIGMFPFIMTSSALIFFSPSWPRRVLRWFVIPARVLRPATPIAPMAPPTRIVVAVIAAHIAAQLALPLRHLVYPGDVLWNEDGMRFAWHVLIREKHGTVTFVAAFADGKRLEISPNNYLTARQDREMSGQPDLILQLARTIARDLTSRGYRSFELHAITAVSLNGRAPVPMIDPAVDLLAVRDFRRTVRARGRAALRRSRNGGDPYQPARAARAVHGHDTDGRGPRVRRLPGRARPRRGVRAHARQAGRGDRGGRRATRQPARSAHQRLRQGRRHPSRDRRVHQRPQEPVPHAARARDPR